MAEQAQHRVQDAMKSFINDVDKGHLRGMERSMHECAAKCCSDTTSSIDAVHECVERCQLPTMKAQRFVQSELERFQESLQRCVSQCQDDIKDKVNPSSSEADITRFRNDFEKCAIACCDKNIERLPSIAKKVKETLQSGKY